MVWYKRQADFPLDTNPGVLGTFADQLLGRMLRYVLESAGAKEVHIMLVDIVDRFPGR